MITFARVAMRASIMGATFLIAVAAFLAAKTLLQHVTVALFNFLSVLGIHAAVKVVAPRVIVGQVRVA